MRRDYTLFLEDIVDCIEKIDEFVRDMSFEEFAKDDKTLSAVVRKLEIIGEATKNIPGDIRRKHKEIPWSDMAKIRDKIIHAYFGINYQIIWKVIKEKLPGLKPMLRQILGGIKNGKREKEGEKEK
ncbi:MAG: hypothetical protein COS08_01870 [Euryarchaeota archaeon CG01_land_8_20_14_3_00_38_12]|nr:MAG: hypothetical protein COS08_01870 [Euryarchaeota archaeon CG01_land_8_20_14_3_00_38_12]PJB20883.1 MAG: hypothetical protein CO114_08310 [Euryarchaeota archaeon CG_4_9_14_3_um_filter_38_12]